MGQQAQTSFIFTNVKLSEASEILEIAYKRHNPDVMPDVMEHNVQCTYIHIYTERPVVREDWSLVGIFPLVSCNMTFIHINRGSGYL